MTSTSTPARFARGGTSKALLFRRDELPEDRTAWDALFLRAMGSPDPNGRQLDGMGGGVSSLSKVCVVGPPTVEGADVDYTFAQVQVRDASVDYSGNCGNMASAIAPFALATGLVARPDGSATVRIHNTNTGKLIDAVLEVRDGLAREDGELTLPGVSGSGAPVRLDFLDPGGAITGSVLPTGRAVDRVGSTDSASDAEAVEVSLVDVSAAVVFVQAEDLGLRGTELPDELDAQPQVLERLATIRALGAVAMGIAPDVESARRGKLVPLVAVISPPQSYRTLSGEAVPADDVDLTVRVISNGQPHRAIPITGGLCTAVAAGIPGTIPHRLAGARGGAIRIGMPSGVLVFDADLDASDATMPVVRSGSIYRTTRVLFEGRVFHDPI